MEVRTVRIFFIKEVVRMRTFFAHVKNRGATDEERRLKDRVKLVKQAKKAKRRRERYLA